MRRLGPGDGIGGTNRPGRADRRPGPVQDIQGRLGGGEPGREADRDHRRDGRRRGLYRRPGRAPLRWDGAGCSPTCTRRPRWASTCGSSPTATPCSWPRCCGPTWSPWSAARVCCPGSAERAFVDIDSLLRPTFGHAKQGASYGHTKIAGKQVLRKGLSPLAATISTRTGAPVIAGIRLRAGRAGSGKGAASMVTDAIATARAAGATGEVVVRGDSAYGHSAVVRACRRAGARFSLVLVKNATVTKAIAAIPDHAWTPGPLPGRGDRPRHRRVDLRRRGRRGTRVHRVRLHPAARSPPG